MSDLTSLRERIGKGADRETDALIQYWIAKPALQNVGPVSEYLATDLARRAPAYTSSLDAALGLVEATLPGAAWSIAKMFRDYAAQVTVVEGFVDIVPVDFRGRAPTPALALLSALLAALSDPRP